MTLREWGRDLGYATVCASAILACLLVTAGDLQASGGTCQESCASQGLSGQAYGICVNQCCAVNPSNCGLVACSPGNGECNGWTQNWCYGRCNSGQTSSCVCKWATPVNKPPDCFCMN
jgi:hypothetical protein